MENFYLVSEIGPGSRGSLHRRGDGKLDPCRLGTSLNNFMNLLHVVVEEQRGGTVPADLNLPLQKRLGFNRFGCSSSCSFGWAFKFGFFLNICQELFFGSH